MNRILLILIILLLWSCHNDSNNLSDDSLISEVFTSSEIQDLQVLFDFFNNSFCKEGEKEDLTNCYKLSLKRIKEYAVDSGGILLDIPIENQLNIYENFQDSTFYRIWATGKKWNQDKPSDTLRDIYIRWNGKYMKFLKLAGYKNEFIKEYHKAILEAGDIPPSLVSGIIMFYNKLEINDLKVKFVIAVHYLTLNDQYSRGKTTIKDSE